MAIYTIRSGAPLHPEDTVLQFITDTIKTGGVLDTQSDLSVGVSGSGGMNVDVSSGRAYLKKSSSSNTYPVRSTTTETVAITSNSSGNPRIDSIVLYLDLSIVPDPNTSQGDDVVFIKAVQGTPAASPSAPDTSQIEADIGSSNPYIILADVYVANGASSFTSNDITDRRTRVIMTSLVYPSDGWNIYDQVIPTRSLSDDPSYELTFANVDLTSILSPGMRIKWTQNGSVSYAIITNTALSGSDTLLTVYGGTDYDVLDTSTYPISGFYYSTSKVPVGFPIDPNKWTLEAKITTETSQSSPTGATWYNIGNLSLDIPIGAWKVEYSAQIDTSKGSGTTQAWTTLSTTNSSESDSEKTIYSFADAGGSSMHRHHYLPMYMSLTTKTTYYLNHKINISGGTLIRISWSGGKTYIRATCAYL